MYQSIHISFFGFLLGPNLMLTLTLTLTLTLIGHIDKELGRNTPSATPNPNPNLTLTLTPKNAAMQI